MKEQNRGYIVLADDDPNDRYFFCLALESAGVSDPVIQFADGQEVIDYLARGNRPPPRLLVLDLKMPRVDGFAVLAWLRTRPRLKGVPVVVFSGSEQEEDVRQAIKLRVTQ